MARYERKTDGTGGHHKSEPAAPRELATWQESKAAQAPNTQLISHGKTRREGIPVPQANPRWHPQAQSWFNSLKLSGQSEFYEASDWAMAVIAAQAYDLFMRTYRTDLLLRFDRLSARLGATIADRNAARILLDEGEPPEIVDEDEEAADASVISWADKLAKREQERLARDQAE